MLFLLCIIIKIRFKGGKWGEVCFSYALGKGGISKIMFFFFGNEGVLFIVWLYEYEFYDFFFKF